VQVAERVDFDAPQLVHPKASTIFQYQTIGWSTAFAVGSFRDNRQTEVCRTILGETDNEFRFE